MLPGDAIPAPRGETDDGWPSHPLPTLALAASLRLDAMLDGALLGVGLTLHEAEMLSSVKDDVAILDHERCRPLGARGLVAADAGTRCGYLLSPDGYERLDDVHVMLAAMELRLREVIGHMDGDEIERILNALESTADHASVG